MNTAVESRWVEVAGVRTHYLFAGQHDSTVILLHGEGVDSAALTWRQSIAPLAERYRVFAPDWPGNGISDAPDVEYTTDYYVQFLSDFMECLTLDRASLV